MTRNLTRPAFYASSLSAPRASLISTCISA